MYDCVDCKRCEDCLECRGCSDIKDCDYCVDLNDAEGMICNMKKAEWEALGKK